ncbi:hypothetical protein [Klebsiella oxytoca]|uniref:hypothetical protein n=1 Tax=Klebsiella oxytoca TaxID=571 RepID=UPI00301BA704
MEKETWTLLGAAVAVVVPLIYNTIKEAIWESKKQKKEEQYIIVQLLFVLDKYISECDFLAGNDGKYDPEFEYKVMSYERPELKLSSVKGDYKYLDTDMLYRLYSIESKHAQVIHTLANLDDDYFFDREFPKYFAKRRELYAIHGLYVVELSEDICCKFKIQHISWGDGFSPAASIRAHLKQIRASHSAATLRRMEERARRISARARKESV